MTESYQAEEQEWSPKRRWSRRETTAKVEEFEQARREESESMRSFSQRAEIPRTTFQYWRERRDKIDAPPGVVEFFESSEGLEFLHQIVTAAQFTITELAGGGIRVVCQFLHLSGLSAFVASSYGAQRQAIINMENEIISYGRQERSRLADAMVFKRITICEDETYHQMILLVAIHPGSGYILLERYVSRLESKAWDLAIEEALEGLNVAVVQQTSDEGSVLLSHGKNGLDVHHSPDVWHGQNELNKATVRVLSSKERKREKACEIAHKKKEAQQEKLANIGPGTPQEIVDEMESNLSKIEAEEVWANLEYLDIKEEQDIVKDSVRAISSCYHPFDLETGRRKEPQEVSGELENCFRDIRGVAKRVSLGKKCKDRISKAYNLVTQMVATILFYHKTVQDWVDELQLPLNLEKVILERCIPGRYIELVATKTKDKDRRAALRELASKLILTPEEKKHHWSLLDENTQLMLDWVIEECAQLFQRSSSCVEGRNGHLSLFHHGLHFISDRKLEALTTVKNYYKMYPDGTTSAERFFGKEPKNMFRHLLTHLEVPARPARARNTSYRQAIAR